LSFPALAGISPLLGENDARFGPRFPAVATAYNPQLQEVAIRAAQACALSNRIQQGTYIGVAGPTYETPAEIGAMRLLGGDAVGMSTVPEIISAAHAGTFSRLHTFLPFTPTNLPNCSTLCMFVCLYAVNCQACQYWGWRSSQIAAKGL
jgi:hypothetical protein